MNLAALTLFELAAFAAISLDKAEIRREFVVTAGDRAIANAPIRVPIAIFGDASAEQRGVTLSYSKGGKTHELAGQLVRPGLGDQAAPPNSFFLHFVIPALKPRESLTLQARIHSREDHPGSAAEQFAWTEADGFPELRFGKRPVLRYMNAKFDDSSKERRDLTYKVFHHLFDPSGERLATKGAGGLYPHHRGIYYGFMKCTYGNGKKADTWHCTGDAHQSAEQTSPGIAGPVLGRHLTTIAWHGEKKEVFAREERELTVYNVPGGQLVEFASILRPTAGPVKLDGDPQHAGFQFRADNEVAAKTAKQTVYIRPDGVDQPGKTRNWPQDKGQVNLPWYAMSFVIGEKRYTVAYLDRPENPKEARFSERDYGRMGSYFVYDLTAEKPLFVRYRLWLQEGLMTPEQVAARAVAFTDPPRVAVK